MYKFSKEQVLDPVFLTKLIRRFKGKELPQFQEKERYYRVQTKILNRSMTEGKPNNKLAHGFCRYITNMATSYFAGKPVRYVFTEGTETEEYKSAVKSVFKDNYMNSLNFEVSKEASKKGIGFYLIFSNESSQLRIKKIEAEAMIPVYSPSLDEFLEAAVRI